MSKPQIGAFLGDRIVDAHALARLSSRGRAPGSFAKLISQKKQGIKTDQLGKGKEGFVKFIEVTLKIITYLLPVIQIISIVFYSGTAHIVLQFTGVVITMLGVLAFIVSVTQMKDN